ncbi:MAG TPA: phenylalanine--tRNA ligase subunit beta [Gaiella sp.]|uniref:phenylalanine--tRNA ligase subunit beta n=1 Tax=Gaiella sp. TaxID=2663207 RepID=UPI002D80E256|nr:phenylalanine--tRNA ligase subunit beta [Gaiella sp.]HET9287745.1 phenylalanine--tRNA ligase subunit beta [Gaiella sp.]
MRVPLSWLREYVETDATAHEMARRLSISALEVDRVIDVGVPDEGDNLGRFVVGRVLSADPHPNADRLQLCQVDVGNPEPQQIVCGAWNFGVGATVAVGLPGALLPGFPGPLEERPLRGQMSRGMILAEDEIGLGADHAGIMLLPGGLEPGSPLAEALPLVDQVLDVTPTMNRPDLLSMVGIAREVAALLDGALRPPDPDDPPVRGGDSLDVRVEDLGGCPRYIGRVFRDVAVGPSPQWLRSRLHLAGMRSISNVVDVTNYVMHVWGSPLHAFDRALLAGGRIVVRRAREGETLRTLDGTLRELLPSDLLITDGERPVALAAIMGGLESEVSDETTEVLLEAANFEPIGVLRTSERLAVRTEGSNKWEKGVDPHAAEPAAALASRLLVDLTGAEVTASVDVHDGLPGRPVVELRPEHASRLIGLDVPEDEQRSILERLELEVDDAWQVTVPTFRARDVTREIDLVEEIARVVLDRVPHTMPLRRAVAGHLTPEQRLRRALEDVLVGMGFAEAYTWSLTPSDPNPDALRLPDPMSGDHAVLRTTLLHGLVEAARVNVDAGNERIRVFELARVYLPADGQLPEERWHLGGIAEGGFEAVRRAVETVYEAFHLPLVVTRTALDHLHPGKAAVTEAGWLGELHPSLLEGEWGAFELDVAELMAPLPERILYEDVITYPANRQDIAIAVSEDVEAAAIVGVAREAGGAELREARVFDVYRGDQVGEGRKSVALHLVFQAPDRTLTDEEVAASRSTIVAALAERLGAELRA